MSRRRKRTLAKRNAQHLAQHSAPRRRISRLWYFLALILPLVAYFAWPVSKEPAGSSQTEKVQLTSEQLVELEIAPKLLKLELFRKLENNPDTPEEILTAIPAMRKETEDAIEQYRQFGAQGQSRFGTLEEILGQGGEPVRVLSDEGQVSGYIYATFKDIPLGKIYECQELNQEEQDIINGSAGLVAMGLGNDHRVVRAFSRFQCMRMTYRIGCLNTPGNLELSNASSINGTVKPAKLSTSGKPIILIGPDPLCRQNSPGKIFLKTACVLLEEYYHAIDPALREQLFEK